MELQIEKLTSEERLANSMAIMGRLTAGEMIAAYEVNPLTHCAEIVVLAAQSRRSLINEL